MVCLGTGYPKETEESVTNALAAGFTCIDSALDYGDQPQIAAGIVNAGASRDSFWLQSKVPGCLGGLTVLPPECYRGTKKAINLNLRRLNVSFVDLMLIHTPPGQDILFHSCHAPMSCSMIQHQWRAMEEAKAEGKVRSIGVSNYCPACYECLKETATELPVVNQVEWHVGLGPDAQGFKSYFDAENVTLQAYSPLGPGAMWAKSGDLIHDEDCLAIGSKHNVSSVQVALKWLVHRAPTLARSRSREHLLQDLDLWSFDLDEEDMALLDARTSPSAFRGNSPSLGCRAPMELV